MAKTLHCSIVTPTTSLFDEDVTYASFPAWDGQQGVMNGQSPQLTQLGVGPLRVDLPGGGSRWFLVDGGFAQVQDDTLTLLTEAATAAEDLSIEEAEAQLAAANARVGQHHEDPQQVAHDQERALAMKSLADAKR